MNFHSSFSTTPNFSKPTPRYRHNLSHGVETAEDLRRSSCFSFFVMTPKSYPRVFSMNIEHLCWFWLWRICHNNLFFKVTGSKQYPLVSVEGNVIRFNDLMEWAISESMCCYQEDKTRYFYSFISWVFFEFLIVERKMDYGKKDCE